jgi:transposase InsO family protein
MTKKQMEELSLLRFSIIAQIVNGLEMFSSKEEFFRMASKKAFNFEGKDRYYTPGTIKDWYHRYKKDGLNGLMPKERNDIGVSRTLGVEAKERIYALKKEFKFITATTIHHKLIEEGFLNKDNFVSLSTITRFINANDLKKPTSEVELKAFSFENANDSWQGDTSWLFNITINGKSEKTCVIAFIDDASRKIVGADIYLSDSAINVQKTLKKAIAKYGVPKRLHLDNGSSYKNHQLALISARLGIVEIFCKVRKASSKGKIERFFNTLKTSWLANLDKSKIKSIDDFQIFLNAFINDYNSKVHSIIKISPNERFKVDFSKFKYKSLEELDLIFLNEVSRRVNNDSTVQIEKEIYEVPSIYIKEKIIIKYNPDDLSKIYIDDKDKLIPIKKLNREENSKVKRQQINYKNIQGGVNND